MTGGHLGREGRVGLEGRDGRDGQPGWVRQMLSSIDLLSRRYDDHEELVRDLALAAEHLAGGDVDLVDELCDLLDHVLREPREEIQLAELPRIHAGDLASRGRQAQWRRC